MPRVIAILLLLPSVAMATCQIEDILLTIRPKAEWILRGTSYSGLQWLDKVQAKPTSTEVSNAISACRDSEIQERQDRDQAKIDLNTTSKTDAERINAIIKYLGLDK